MVRSDSPENAPSTWLRLTRRIGIGDEYAQSTYGRQLESLKNFTSLGALSKKLKPGTNLVSALAGVAVTAAMYGVYSVHGSKNWLKTHLGIETGKPKFLGRLITGFGLYPIEEGISNFGTLCTILGMTAGMTSRANAVRNTKVGAYLGHFAIAMGAGSALSETRYAGKMFYHDVEPPSPASESAETGANVGVTGPTAVVTA